MVGSILYLKSPSRCPLFRACFLMARKGKKKADVLDSLCPWDDVGAVASGHHELENDFLSYASREVVLERTLQEPSKIAGDGTPTRPVSPIQKAPNQQKHKPLRKEAKGVQSAYGSLSGACVDIHDRARVLSTAASTTRSCSVKPSRMESKQARVEAEPSKNVRVAKRPPENIACPNKSLRPVSPSFLFTDDDKAISARSDEPSAHKHPEHLRRRRWYVSEGKPVVARPTTKPSRFPGASVACGAEDKCVQESTAATMKRGKASKDARNAVLLQQHRQYVRLFRRLRTAGSKREPEVPPAGVLGAMALSPPKDHVSVGGTAGGSWLSGKYCSITDELCTIMCTAESMGSTSAKDEPFHKIYHTPGHSISVTEHQRIVRRVAAAYHTSYRKHLKQLHSQMVHKIHAFEKEVRKYFHSMDLKHREKLSNIGGKYVHTKSRLKHLMDASKELRVANASLARNLASLGGQSSVAVWRDMYNHVFKVGELLHAWTPEDHKLPEKPVWADELQALVLKLLSHTQHVAQEFSDSESLSANGKDDADTSESADRPEYTTGIRIYGSPTPQEWELLRSARSEHEDLDHMSLLSADELAYGLAEVGIQTEGESHVDDIVVENRCSGGNGDCTFCMGESRTIRGRCDASTYTDIIQSSDGTTMTESVADHWYECWEKLFGEVVERISTSRARLNSARSAIGDLNHFLDAVHADLTCRKCFGYFKNAMLVSECGHSFCYDCIGRMVDAESNQFVCCECHVAFFVTQPEFHRCVEGCQCEFQGDRSGSRQFTRNEALDSVVAKYTVFVDRKQTDDLLELFMKSFSIMHV